MQLNTKKMDLWQTSLSFMGRIVTGEGLCPDLEQVRAINEMLCLMDVKGVQRLRGFVNYQAKFLLRISEWSTCFEILWSLQTSGHPMWCEWKRFGSCTAPERSTPGLCQWSPDRNGNLICTHWKGTTSCSICIYIHLVNTSQCWVTIDC